MSGIGDTTFSLIPNIGFRNVLYEVTGYLLWRFQVLTATCVKMAVFCDIARNPEDSHLRVAF